MGGQGSGRPSKTDSIIRKTTEQVLPVAQQNTGKFILPNLSGLKDRLEKGIEGVAYKKDGIPTNAPSLTAIDSVPLAERVSVAGDGEVTSTTRGHLINLTWTYSQGTNPAEGFEIVITGEDNGFTYTYYVGSDKTEATCATGNISGGITASIRAFRVDSTGMRFSAASSTLYSVANSTTSYTGYTLLSGRSGGQTVKGGTAASESLTVQGTGTADETPLRIRKGSAYDVGEHCAIDWNGFNTEANIHARIACESDSASSYNLDFYTNNADDSTPNKRMRIKSDGGITFNEAYTFPTADGTANQVLQTDGSGNLSFATVGGSSLWTDGGTVTYLTSTTDDLSVGGTTIANGAFTVDVSTQTTRIGDGSTANAKLTMYSSAGNTGQLEYNTNDNLVFTGGDLGIGGDPSTRLHAVTGAGTVPTLAARTIGVLQNNNDTSDGCALTILGGTVGQSVVNFGDADDEDIGQILYDHNEDSYNIKTAATEILEANTSKYHVKVPINATTGAQIIVRKSADESVTSSTTLQNDDELTLDLDRSATYLIEGSIFATSSSGTPDIKIRFQGALSDVIDIGYIAAEAQGVRRAELLEGTTTSATSSNIPINANTVDVIQISGTVSTSASEGNLTLQWAQNSSNANATTVKQGSYLKAVRIS